MNLNKKDLITHVLVKKPKTRQDDFLLILQVWILELGDEADESLKSSMRTLLTAFRDGKISNFETIRRCRQKIQEQVVNLRGSNYRIRHEHAEGVRESIVDG